MKSTKIIWFKNLSYYAIDGGINYLKWNVTNAYFVVLISKRFFKIFLDQSELKTISGSRKTYVLIAIGLFSIDIKRLNLIESRISKSYRNIGNTQNSKIEKAYVSQAIKINQTFVSGLSKPTLLSKNIKVKSLNP